LKLLDNLIDFSNYFSKMKAIKNKAKKKGLSYPFIYYISFSYKICSIIWI